mmetsp:Transcript_40655/g.84624  ORF Transcript_40655/g.84624 Transcript_40655/m.84624 type:complete len:224 (-) Transcript_40655:1028-1699(-)
MRVFTSATAPHRRHTSSRRGRPSTNERSSSNSSTAPLVLEEETTSDTTASGRSDAVLDLEREKTRLESFEAYVLVSILTASASFTILSEVTAPDSSSLSQLATVATVFISGLSAIAGLHATIVFSLCVLYGKTALGLYRDVQYAQFVKDTAPQRIRAFNSFSTSLLLFALQVELLLCEKAPPAFQGVAILVAMATTGALVWDWHSILQAAQRIFVPHEIEKMQ